ncbi:MAG: hypothetical protein NTX03_15445 [Bacteroidetes bacterium]|nr:hypothetical protein [Bacteroidota bacterium]
MKEEKRQSNEKEYQYWETTVGGGRIYFKEVIAKRNGGKAIYKKAVDENENTISFVQEIYNSKHELTEIHKKYPVDEGHQKIK